MHIFVFFLGLFVVSARDDIPHADEVQTLIKDIWEIRMAKLRKSINIMVQDKETHARVRCHGGQSIKDIVP